MRGLPFSRSLRVTSVVVLSFFLWTFGGLFDIAYALKNTQSSVHSRQSETKGPEEKFGEKIDEVFETVSDATADTDTKKSRLKSKAAEIESLDGEIKKQFDKTEKKLKDDGLPAEILQRHYNFVKHYNDNLNELRKNLDDIDKAKNKAEADAAIEKAKAYLETVKPPKKHKPLDPNKLPHRTPEIKNYEVVEKQSVAIEEKPTLSLAEPILIASADSLAGLLPQVTVSAIAMTQSLPTAADLAQTIEVQFTPEIQAKAAELGYNPVKIYEYVRNNFEYEPYYGSLKGAQQTFLERAGNDFDQASLLIALLRASNIPARYVYGTVELPMDRLMNWLGGVNNPNTAAQIMATNGIPGTLITEGGTIKYAQFEHMWVEAYVDMFPSMGSVNKEGQYWTPIDPSVKEMQIADSLDISKSLPFDETAYLNSSDEMSPVLLYIYKLKDYYNTNYDYNFMKVFHAAVKIKQEFGIFLGTLSYKVVNDQKYSEIPDMKRHRITLGFSSSGLYDINTVSVTKTYPEMVGKKVAISYTAATPNDKAVIDNYGGLLSTPAYLIKVKPEIRLNGATILMGQEMGLGESLSLAIDISSPNLNRDVKTTDITHGISYAVGLPALDYPGTQLVNQIDVLRTLEGTLNDSINAMDSRAGELLQNIAIEYFGQLNGISKSIEGIMHVRNTKLPSVALISVDATFNEVFGVALSPPIMNGVSIDAIRVACSPISLDGDMNERREFIKHRGLNSSYLEHKILENLLRVESISAVKAIQIAARNSIPIYSINKGNVDNILPTLTVSSSAKVDIQNAVNTGKEVTISRDNVTLYDWMGVGYIVRDPVTGSGAYMISSSLAGGGTVKPYYDAFPAAVGKMAYFLVGQPTPGTSQTDVLNWWFSEDSLMILGERLRPIWLNYGYETTVILEVNRRQFLEAARDPDTWILQYTGHGNIDLLGLGPYDIVTPSDIAGADPKLVFLNACYSARNGSFKDAFGIDGRYGGVSRQEAFIGWDYLAFGIASDTFVFEFWLLMGITGSSVGSVILGLKALAGAMPYDYLAWWNNISNIQVLGDSSTTLVP